jgi:hypothetical protein
MCGRQPAVGPERRSRHRERPTLDEVQPPRRHPRPQNAPLGTCETLLVQLHVQRIDRPPSMGKATPVMKDASSLARNSTA